MGLVMNPPYMYLEVGVVERVRRISWRGWAGAVQESRGSWLQCLGIEGLSLGPLTPSSPPRPTTPEGGERKVHRN